MKKLLLLVVAVLALTSCEKEEMKRERRGPRAEVEEPSITSKRDATGAIAPQLNISIDGINLFGSSSIYSSESINWANESTVFLNGDLGYRILRSTDPKKPILGLTPVVLNSAGEVVVDKSRAKLNPVYADTSELLGGYDASVDAYSVSEGAFRGSVISTRNNVITRVRDVIISISQASLTGKSSGPELGFEDYFGHATELCDGFNSDTHLFSLDLAEEAPNLWYVAPLVISINRYQSSYWQDKLTDILYDHSDVDYRTKTGSIHKIYAVKGGTVSGFKSDIDRVSVRYKFKEGKVTQINLDLYDNSNPEVEAQFEWEPSNIAGYTANTYPLDDERVGEGSGMLLESGGYFGMISENGAIKDDSGCYLSYIRLTTIGSMFPVTSDFDPRRD